MSDLEFVSIDEHGVEQEWIDPIVSINEFDTHYVVNNGYHDYEVTKQDGWSYIQRIKRN